MTEPKITKVTEIIENIDWYIDQLTPNEKDKDYVVKTIANLLEFTANYFSQIDKSERNTLKLIAYQAVNDLYKYSSNVKFMNFSSGLFLSSVVKGIFDQLAEKDIYVFFVIDNTMEDDRLGAFITAYSKAGFNVIDEPENGKNLIEDIKSKILPKRNTLLMFKNYELEKPILSNLFEFLHGYSDDNNVTGFKSSGYLDTKSYAWGIVI
ncbi:MAG: hypothetical protein NTU81_00410 [Candidatus Nomurabacteria bacterium]|nr:hypothetical protein [Candidatus Nomurabacteria bacterium]